MWSVKTRTVARESSIGCLNLCKEQWRSQEFCLGGASHWRRQISNFRYLAHRSFWRHWSISGLLKQHMTSSIFYQSAMDVRRKFSRGGATSTFCLSFSGCYRCSGVRRKFSLGGFIQCHMVVTLYLVCLWLWAFAEMFPGGKICTFNSNSASPCFRTFPMIWNAASARDEISLRKWSGGAAYLRTFRGSICCKKCVLLAAMLRFHSCFFTYRINQGWANLFNRGVICRKPNPASRKTSL